MARMIAIILAVSWTTAEALVVSKSNVVAMANRLKSLEASRSNLDQVVAMANKGQMRPDMISKMMANIENTWKAQAHAFTECKTTGEAFNCKEAPKAFLSSCEKVGDVIFLASSGQAEESKEYMFDVCDSKNIGGSWHRATCELVSNAMTSRMSLNAEDNRNHADKHTADACTGLWTHFVEEQTVENEKEAKEAAEHEAMGEEQEKLSEEKVKLAEEHVASKPPSAPAAPLTEKKAAETEAQRAEERAKSPLGMAVAKALRKAKQSMLAEADPKKDKKIDLSKPMPLKAQEQGFSGKMVQHKDGKSVSKDWRKEYGHVKEVKEVKPKKSASISSMASVIVLLAAAALQFSQ